jgi:hypothetical protein
VRAISLAFGEPAERARQIGVALDGLERVHGAFGLEIAAIATLQVTGGDAIGHAPDPRAGISDRVAASDHLRERLRDRIARDLGVAAERD